MRQKNPTRMAWLVILGAFAAFLLLCAAVPISTRSYLLYSTTPKLANFEVNAGTPRVREPQDPAPIAVTRQIQLGEGSTIETDGNSRGIVTLFDGSTIIVFSDTAIKLREMQIPSFEWGQAPVTVDIEHIRGRIRIAPSPLYTLESSISHMRVFRVRTNDLIATLDEGSYAMDVYADSSQLTATNGRADVIAQGRAVSLNRGQRTVVTRGNPPLGPLPAARDLIVNGDYMDPFVVGWNSFQDSTSPGAVQGTSEVATLGDRQTVHIVRANSGQVSAITGVIQTINKEVSDFRILKLTADIRLKYQSLSGGGMLSSEYPLILRLRYRDQYGSEAEWVHGFYYQNTTANPTINGEAVAMDAWVPFESGNLFELTDPRPFYITTLQIYASGWDYESYVTNVRLVVE